MSRFGFPSRIEKKPAASSTRVSGADANPYLVTAAILAGVHYGLKNRCEPGRMIEEGEVIRLKQKIRESLGLLLLTSFRAAGFFPNTWARITAA